MLRYNEVKSRSGERRLIARSVEQADTGAQ